MGRVFVSSVVGGTSSANRGTVAAIDVLARSSGMVSDLACNVDLLFKVGGPFGQPDFTGVVPGRWSEVKQRFRVQIAVPEDLDGEPPKVFLARQIRSARNVAIPRLRKHLDPPAVEAVDRALALLTESLE